jgi:predicted TIM-barrel fold metal-dependent hydrolase
MTLTGFISADSHVNEPEDAFARIPKALRAKGPHYVQDPPGKKGLYLIIEGHSPDPVGNTFLAGTNREPSIVKDRVENFTWDRWRGPWDATARPADMDLDGVKIEVLYPSLSRNLYGLSGKDTPLQVAGLKSYNDWILEYCGAVPGRLYAVCLLSAIDIEWSVKEIERCSNLGHVGAMLPANVPAELSYADPRYEPIWAACESLGFPIHFHINIKQSADRDSYEPGRHEESMIDVGNRLMNRSILEGPRLMKDILFGLVLENHPRLKVIFAEYELLWVMPFLTRLDATVERYGREHPDIPHMTTLPSDAIRRQVYFTFQDDPAGVAAAEVLGLEDNIMWASDYPHGGATWPHSKEIVANQVKDMSEERAKQLVWDNAARLYGIS